MVASVIRILLPIMTAFVCGMICRRLHILDASGCQTLKNLVSYIMLPTVLFNAFLFADYTVQSLSVIIVVFVALTAEFALGFVLRRFVPGRGGAMPFLFATMECGSIGYPLIAMLFGQQGTSDMAIIDVGHTVFLFLLVVPVLKITEGESPKLKDVARQALTSPAFDAMLIGIALGLLGVDEWLRAHTAGYDIYDAVIDYITAPTGVLVLLTLGHDAALDKSLMKPVAMTAVGRLLVMWAFCGVSIAVISLFGAIPKSMLVALMLAFSLPASFVIPVTGKFEGQRDYVSATMSLCTLLTLASFAVLAVFAMR